MSVLFAGAVLAQKAEDFPDIEIKIDAVERPHRTKAASDLAHFEKNGHGLHGQPDEGSSPRGVQRDIRETKR
jgi:hypothetical protein